MNYVIYFFKEIAGKDIQIYLKKTERVKRKPNKRESRSQRWPFEPADCNFCETCDTRISKSNTSHDETKTHENKMLEINEILETNGNNPFALPPESAFKITPALQFIRAKVSPIEKN